MPIRVAAPLLPVVVSVMPEPPVLNTVPHSDALVAGFQPTLELAREM